MTGDTASPTPSLRKQAEDIIDEGMEWEELASQLDVSDYEHLDGHPDWRQGTSFRPMFLSYLWSDVENEPLTSVRRKLEENRDLAVAFGFDPDDLPSESTFRPCRVESRFDDLEEVVLGAADTIRDTAAYCGAPIGFDLGSINDPDNDGDDSSDGPTERTVQRLLRKKRGEVFDELVKVVIPSLSISRPEDATYSEKELLVLEAIAAILGLAANDGGHKLGNKINPDPDLDDPYYMDGPSGETLLDAMKEMSVDDIATTINFGLRKTYQRAKPRLQELENVDGKRFGSRAKIALDITYVAYYGDRDELVWVQGAPEDKEYSWCHKFATAVVVGENTHYVLAVTPLGNPEWADNDEQPGKDLSYHVGDVARRLLDRADEFVNIHRVYADREFAAADVISALEDKNLRYVIPISKNHRIKRKCDRFGELKRGYHIEEEGEVKDTPLYVENEYGIYGKVKGETTTTRVETNLVILPPDDDDETHGDGSPQPFITNLDLSDEIALDRRWAKEKVDNYSARGGIEESYSSIKQAAAWTTSKEFVVRWYHFGFACLVYNLWLLVDFLVQERINVIETRKKPRITLNDFLDCLSKRLIKLI